MRIRDWHQYQHFNNRRPPWIKLYRETFLDQRDISLISDCAHRVLVGLLLLASEDKGMQGNLPPVPDIAFRLRMEESKIIKALKELGPWVEQDDISVISGRYQDDAPERETERETDIAQTDSAESSEPVFLNLPTNNGKRYPITDGLVREWGLLYPAVDIEQEIRKAKGWLDSNPTKRKTYGGMKRFVNGWLSRCQDRGGSNGSVSQSGSDYGKGAI